MRGAYTDGETDAQRAAAAAAESVELEQPARHSRTSIRASVWTPLRQLRSSLRIATTDGGTVVIRLRFTPPVGDPRLGRTGSTTTTALVLADKDAGRRGPTARRYRRRPVQAAEEQLSCSVARQVCLLRAEGYARVSAMGMWSITVRRGGLVT